jgi:hypothetical protein
MGEMRNAYNILVGKPKGKRPRVDLKYWTGSQGKIGWEMVDWLHLSRDRDQWWALVNTVMNFGVS